MSGTMKWFVGCAMIIFFGLGILIGYSVSITFHVVDTTIAEYHRTNLLILYEVKE